MLETTEILMSQVLALDFLEVNIGEIALINLNLVEPHG